MGNTEPQATAVIKETHDTELGTFQITLTSNPKGKWAWHWASPNKWRASGSLGHPCASEETARETVITEIEGFTVDELSGQSGMFLVGTVDDPGLHRIEP